jgi:hypothetical protein
MVEHRNVCVIFQSGVFMSYEFYFFWGGGQCAEKIKEERKCKSVNQGTLWFFRNTHEVYGSP